MEIIKKKCVNILYYKINYYIIKYNKFHKINNKLLINNNKKLMI